MAAFDPSKNRTIQILRGAKAGNYGVLAAICYNVEHLTALVRAAEAKRSSLILLLFPSTDFAAPFVSSFNPANPCGALGDDTLQPTVSDAGLGFSPLALSQSSLLNISPFEWYDLLAQDAISHIQRLNNLPNGDTRWAFDESTLSRRQSPIPESPNQDSSQRPIFGQGDAPVVPPWNTTSNIELSRSDVVYFRYYVDVVGPILDLFDHERHFSNVVPHLAVRNTGLLKSILAVAARHQSLGSQSDDAGAPSNPSSPNTNCQGSPRELEPDRSGRISTGGNWSCSKSDTAKRRYGVVCASARGIWPRLLNEFAASCRQEMW